MANLPGKPSSRPTADLPARPASDADSRRARKRSGDTKKRRSERTSRNSADAGAPGPSGEAKPVAELGDDFVPFTLSEPEDEAPPAPAPRREWDEGKRSPRGRDRERGRDGERERGAKGKEREVERDDGYASKKQRVDAASRRAPWVAEVEWERCANVAEMYVSQSPPLRLTSCAFIGHKLMVCVSVGCIRRCKPSSTLFRLPLWNMRSGGWLLPLSRTR